MYSIIKYFSFFLIFIFQILNSFSQSNDNFRAGSAYSLSGKTYVLTVFISENNQWSKDDKQKELEKIKEAEAWLTAQASNFSQEIEFQNGSFGLDESIKAHNIVSGTGSGAEPVDLVSKYLKQIGYTNSEQFHDWVLENTDCTNSLVILLANKPGRGYAMNYSRDYDKELYFVEGCMLYSEYSNGTELLSSTIAHEILHLFGAWDLYETFQQKKDREEKARKIYPNDIMLRVTYNINELSIGNLTAWRVGLNVEEEHIFEWFRY